MTICTCVCLQPPIMVFCHTEIGLCVHVTVTHQLSAHSFDSICINFNSQRLFVHIDVMQIVVWPAQVNFLAFFCSTQTKQLAQTNIRVVPVVILQKFID